MNDFLQQLPTFTTGVTTLHNLLVPVVLVLMVAGLLLKALQAHAERTLGALMPYFVRMAVIVFLTASLAVWANMIQAGVNDLVSQLGLTQIGGNVYQAYLQAVQQRFGTNSVAGNIAQATSATSTASGFNVPVEGDTSAVFSTTPSATGTTVTHYAYAGDSTPDSNSSQGIGAFGPYLTPGSLVPMQSAALTPAAAAQYNVQQGQSFTITTLGGQTYNLVYADVVPTGGPNEQPAGASVVDIYDPNGVLGGYNFSQVVTSFNDGPVLANAAGANPTVGEWLSNPAGTLQKYIIEKLVWLLSLAALGIMWLMSAIQQILYLIEIAISPIFLGCLCIPALVLIGTRFLSSLVALCLWPLAWAVCDLVTRFLINIAVNPTSNVAIQLFSFGVMQLGLWIVLAIWVIGSSVVGPWLITRSLVAGSSAIAAVIGGTIGAAAASTPGIAYKTAAIASGAGAGAAVAGGTNGASSIASATRMNPTENYATRPMNNSEPAGKT
jgi:hypothetical protein